MRPYNQKNKNSVDRIEIIFRKGKTKMMNIRIKKVVLKKVYETSTHTQILFNTYVEVIKV